MPSVRVINENGDIETQEVVSRDAAVIPDDRTNFEPSVVQRVEYDHTGSSSAITSECGETENRRESDKKPDITVEGIITEDEIPAAKGLKKGDEITLVSDIHQGQVFVKRLTITQETDLLYYVESGDKQLAFSFQLQLKQPE